MAVNKQPLSFFLRLLLLKSKRSANINTIRPLKTTFKRDRGHLVILFIYSLLALLLASIVAKLRIYFAFQLGTKVSIL